MAAITSPGVQVIYHYGNWSQTLGRLTVPPTTTVDGKGREEKEMPARPIQLVSHGPFKSQAARDAAEQYGDDAYASYIEQHTLELAAKFPAERDSFMTRTLAEALQGNDGA